MSFLVFQRDHLRSTSEIICGARSFAVQFGGHNSRRGIICGAVQQSKIEYRSVTSQKNKFVKLWDLVPFSGKASLEKGPCQNLPLNCISQPKYKG